MSCTSSLSFRSSLLTAFLLSVCLTSTCASSQSQALTLPRNLAELVNESPTVVQGWVADVTLERHPQLNHLMTVVVTLQVESTLKGDATRSYTFRQAVLDRRDQEEKMGYRIGQHVLLLLIKPSEYGLTSPAGMEQGRFRIETGRDGKLQATNGFGNAGLFRGLNTQGLSLKPEAKAMMAKPGVGPVPLDHLKSVIRAIAVANPQ
jgi:hypothetical protein